MAFVDGLKLAEIVEQARCFVRREPSAGQPLLARLLDSVVADLRDFVISFQRLKFCEGFASRTITPVRWGAWF